MGVLAVGDEPADDALICKRRADHAGRSRAELAHRVVEVSDRARPCVEDRFGFFRGGVRVSKADDDPRSGEPCDHLVRHGGGRKGDHHDAGARRDQRLSVLLTHRADPFRRMHPFSARIDEGSLDMNPERAGNAHMRQPSGGQRRGQNFRRVGHNRRQKSRHPLAPVGGGDPGDALDRRLGVEQHAAAAVDLPVDETRREDSAAEIDLLAVARAILQFDQRMDSSAVDDERVIVEKPLAVEEARSGKDFHCAASRSLVTTPPASRIAPSVASYSGLASMAAISGSR